MSDSDSPCLPRRGRKDDPRMVGPWKLGRTIGQGASGRVRLARNRQTGEHAAVKIISKTFFQSRLTMTAVGEDAANALLAAEREIVIMKLIEHPNILQLIDVWITPSELILILEYADGGELFDHLCKRGRLPISDATNYFQQIMTAVDYCHQFNICHRDLKPENILLDNENKIKIADFGMAIWQGGDDLLQTACGSPHYAAPEVIMGLAYDGKMSDIWSCGVILYALLLSKLPFDHEDLGTLLSLIQAGKYKIPADLDPNAKDLLSRMLEVDVSKRITMPQILNHPFFLSQPLKYSVPSSPQLGHPRRALSTIDDIDHDMFDNLQTLWHEVSPDNLVEQLLSEEDSWQKDVYYLLIQYREGRIYKQKHDDEEFAARQARRKSQMKEQPSEHRNVKRRSTRKRTSPPAREAQDHSFIVVSSSDLGDVVLDDFVHVSPATLERPSNVPSIRSPNLDGYNDEDAPMSPFNRVPPTTPLNPMSPNPQFWSAGLGVPSLNTVSGANGESQEFFQQVVDLLKSMEDRDAAAMKVPSPNPNDVPSPTPLPETFGIRKVVRRSGLRVPSTPVIDMFAGLGIGDEEICAAYHEEENEPNTFAGAMAQLPAQSDLQPASATLSPGVRNMVYVDEQSSLQSPIAPLRPRRISRQPVPSSAADKENQLDGPSKPVPADVLGMRPSDLADHVPKLARPVLGEKKVQFTEPSQGLPQKVKRKKPPQLDLSPPSPGLTDGASTPSDTPFVVTPTDFSPPPSPPRRSWFANPFKGKAAQYQLLSMLDAFTSRDECQRLLSGMGINATVQPFSENMTDIISPRSSTVSPPGPGVLKCIMAELRDPAGAMGVVRAVRFRVELRRPTPSQSAAGFAVALHFVHEKGASASFKLVFNQLRRKWDLDDAVAAKLVGMKPPGGVLRRSFEEAMRTYGELGVIRS